MNNETDKLKGSAKEAAGDLLGDEDLQEEGEQEQKAARKQQEAEELEDEAQAKRKQAQGHEGAAESAD